MSQKWMTSEILTAIREKDLPCAKAKRSRNCDDTRLKYKWAKNKVNPMIRFAKRTHFRKKFQEARSEMKKTWFLINNLRGGNILTPKQRLSSSFSADDETVEN